MQNPTTLAIEVVEEAVCGHPDCLIGFTSDNPPYEARERRAEHHADGSTHEYTYTEQRPWHGACVIAYNLTLPKDLP